MRRVAAVADDAVRGQRLGRERRLGMLCAIVANGLRCFGFYGKGGRLDFWRITPQSLVTLKRHPFGFQQSQKFGVAFFHKTKIRRNRFGCRPLPDRRRDPVGRSLGSFRLGHRRECRPR
jgi:hypothetical protein